MSMQSLTTPTRCPGSEVNDYPDIVSLQSTTKPTSGLRSQQLPCLANFAVFEINIQFLSAFVPYFKNKNKKCPPFLRSHLRHKGIAPAKSTTTSTQCPCSQRLRRFIFCKYFREIGKILWHRFSLFIYCRLVLHFCDSKNGGRKSRDTVPVSKTFRNCIGTHVTIQQILPPISFFS